MGYEPRSPGKKSNALTTQRLYSSDILFRVGVLFIEATHHVICHPDLPTTADNLEGMKEDAMGHYFERVILYDYEKIL